MSVELITVLLFGALLFFLMLFLIGKVHPDCCTVHGVQQGTIKYRPDPINSKIECHITD